MLSWIKVNASFKSWREDEDRKTKQHIVFGIGSIHEKDKWQLGHNWEGLTRTELDEECWWMAYASPRGVTDVSSWIQFLNCYVSIFVSVNVITINVFLDVPISAIFFLDAFSYDQLWGVQFIDYYYYFVSLIYIINIIELIVNIFQVVFLHTCYSYRKCK